MPDQKQGQLASLIISIIILVIVIILIIIVCCNWNNANNTQPLIQNPQAAAALYAHEHAYAHAHGNKNNFNENGPSVQCQGKALGDICTIQQQVGECVEDGDNDKYSVCCMNNYGDCFSTVLW
jgi:hypothetical protein